MKGLLLHCGGELKTREEVFAVPPPAATDSYVPLSYESLVTRIEKQLRVEGLKVKDEKLALAKSGQRLFGLIEVELPGFAERDYGCVIGFRNSYDKSCSTGLCIGATVFVCDNLSFQGSEVTFQRKHTANLLKDLSWILSEATAKLPLQFETQAKIFESYRNTEVSNPEAHDLAIQMYDARGINITDMPSLLKEWREPRHEEFKARGQSLWRLFNAATEVIKGDLWRLPVKSRAIHEVLDSFCRTKNEGTALVA